MLCFYDAYKLKREGEMSVKQPDQLKVSLKTLQEIVPHLQRLFNWILTVKTRIRFQGSPFDIYGEKWNNGISFSSNTLFFSRQLSFHQCFIFIDLYHTAVTGRPLAAAVKRDDFTSLKEGEEEK
jgi:hypothetical protein